MYRQPGMRLVVHEEHGYTRMVMIPADDTLTEPDKSPLAPPRIAGSRNRGNFEVVRTGAVAPFVEPQRALRSSLTGDRDGQDQSSPKPR